MNGRNAQLSHLKAELYTKDNGLVMLEMVTESRIGPMEQNTKANGKKIKHMDMESSGMWMEIFLKACGRKIRQMGKGFTRTSMVRSMRGSGKTICKMDTESRLGPMAQDTRVTTRMEKSTGMALIHGWTEACM